MAGKMLSHISEGDHSGADRDFDKQEIFGDHSPFYAFNDDAAFDGCCQYCGDGTAA
jgi:hypothetical protein